MNASSAYRQSSKLVKALLNPQRYPDGAESVTLIETHISWVLLAGAYVYKIKKPVSFGFLDFGTLEKRRFYCDEEIRLNRRLCAELYLDVVPITGTAEQPVLGGSGAVVDYAVKMRRFDPASLLNERAEQGCLQADDIDRIAEVMSRFHLGAEAASADSPYGEAE
ncbi:MAG: AAA family ATPase, partial [Gammaproteobacteria bacterium]